MARTRPTVLTAILAVVLLAVLTSAIRSATYSLGLSVEVTQYALPGTLGWPFLPRVSLLSLSVFIGQIVVMAAVVGLISWLGSRAAAARGGFWAVLFSVWMAAILAGYLSAPLAAVRIFAGTSVDPATIGRQLTLLASNGGFFGLVYGWIAGIVAGIVHGLGARR